jgi:hypothetical protein
VATNESFSFLSNFLIHYQCYLYLQALIIYNFMSKLSENVELRLKAAQELLKKNKEKGMQSPNYIHIIITFRKESLINNLIQSQKQVQSEMVTE